MIAVTQNSRAAVGEEGEGEHGGLGAGAATTGGTR